MIDNEYLRTFLIVFGLFPTSLLLSALFVAKFIWLPFKKKCEKQHLPPLPYENRYPFVNDERITDNSGCDLFNTLIMDYTPQGNVLLRYNDHENTFDYWADDNIQYRYLETLTRKYVQSFRCEHLYINRTEELRKKFLKLKEIKKKELEDKKNNVKPKKTDSVFATLKSGNIKSNKTSENALVAAKANKYIKRGRLKECAFFKPEPKKPVQFSFADFKKLF